MKFLNIYFAIHPEDLNSKPYMFKAPFDAEIRKGHNYLVETRLGQKKVVAITNNLVLPEEDVVELKRVVGATNLRDTLGEMVQMLKTWEEK